MATNNDEMRIYDILSPQQKSGLTRKINNAKAKIRTIEARAETGGKLTPTETKQIKSLEGLINSYKDSLDYDKVNIAAKKARRKKEDRIARRSDPDASAKSQVKTEKYKRERKAKIRRDETKGKGTSKRDADLQKDVTAEEDKIRSKTRNKADYNKSARSEAVKQAKYNLEDMAFKRRTNPVTLNKKVPFPTRKVAALGGISAAGALSGGKYLSDWGDTFGAAYDDNVVNDNTGVSNSALGALGITADVSSYLPGGATGAAALGYGAKYGTDKFKNMYNPSSNPEGLGRIASTKQAGKDALQAAKDAMRRIQLGYGSATDFVTAKDLRQTDLETETRRVSKEKAYRELDKQKSDRWGGTERKKLERHNKRLAKEERQLDKQTKSDAEAKAKVDKIRNTGTRSLMAKDIQKDIDARVFRQQQISGELKGFDDIFNPGDEPYKASLDGENATLRKEIIALKVEQDSLNTAINDDDIATKFKNRINKMEPKGYDSEKWGIKAGAEKAKLIGSEGADKLKNSADDLFDSGKQVFEDAKPKVEQAINKGVDGAKTWWEQAKAVPGNTYDRVTGRGASQPGAGLSRTPVTSDNAAVTEPGKPLGKIAKTAKVGGAIATGVAPGGALNFALKNKRDLEEQGVSPIVQNLINSGASESEINEAIREDMYATAFRNTGIPEVSGQVTDWLDKDMSGYDRAGDVIGTAGDVVTGAAQGLYDSAMGMGDLYNRTKDWATGQGEFGELYNPDGTERKIMGYDTPGGVYSPGAALGANTYASGGTSTSAGANTVEPKTSGVTAAGTEGQEKLDKRKQAEANNKRLWAVQKDAAHRKYGGYNNAQDYADTFGVKALNTSDGRYGNTPIYVSADGTSFSDVPANVMDPAKYDQVASKAADAARQQYLKFEQATKAQAADNALPKYLRGKGLSENYGKLNAVDKMKMHTEAYKVDSANASKVDTYARELQNLQNLNSQEKNIVSAQQANVVNRLNQNLASPSEAQSLRVQQNKALQEGAMQWPAVLGGPDDIDYATHNPYDNLPGDMRNILPGRATDIESVEAIARYDMRNNPNYVK